MSLSPCDTVCRYTPTFQRTRVFPLALVAVFFFFFESEPYTRSREQGPEMCHTDQRDQNARRRASTRACAQHTHTPLSGRLRLPSRFRDDRLSSSLRGRGSSRPASEVFMPLPRGDILDAGTLPPPPPLPLRPRAHRRSSGAFIPLFIFPMRFHLSCSPQPHFGYDTFPSVYIYSYTNGQIFFASKEKRPRKM